MTTRTISDLPGGPAASASASVPSTANSNEPMAPGDEAPEGTPGTGEAPCRACGGSGNVDDRTCPECQGTGKVTVGVGGA